MKILVLRILEKAGLYYRKTESINFLKRELNVFKGTIRNISDKNDGSLLELDIHHKVILVTSSLQ